MADQAPDNGTDTAPNNAPDAGTVTITGNPPAAPAQPQGAGYALQGPVTPDQTAPYLKQEDAAWAQDLANQHITPETYQSLYDSKDTLGKIGTLFGMLVSGAGSGLAHQQNAVLSSMSQQIQNDLDAQKTSKANAQNFINLNQQHQTQLAQQGLIGAQAANTATQARINADALAHTQANRAAFQYLNQQVQGLATAAAADPTNVQKAQQLQRAQQALGVVGQGIDAQNSNIIDKAGATSALLHGLSGQSAATGAPGAAPDAQFAATQQGLIASGNPALGALAQDRSAKHVPGLGDASVPLSADDRNQITAGTTFQDQLQRFRDWTASHSGDLSPSDYKTGAALAAGLQGAYRQATHGGVYKAGEQDFISSIIDSDPTKFFNSVRVMPQLNAVQKDSSTQLNTLLKSKGLPNYAPQAQSNQSAGNSSQDQAAAAWAKANPNDPRAAQIIQRLQSKGQ